MELEYGVHAKKILENACEYRSGFIVRTIVLGSPRTRRAHAISHLASAT